MRSGFLVLRSNRRDQRESLFALQIMGNGWIKLHRQLQLKGYYRQSQYIHLWVHLLLCANHKRTEYMTNGQIIHIKEGQLLTGRKLLAEGTGIPETTIERILKVLESEHQIEQQKTTKYRLITIVKWDTYQKADSTSDSKRTASGQQADTNKNVKKDKNEKKQTTAQSADDEVARFIHLFKEINPSIGRLYGRPPQRASAERLLKLHPLSWWSEFMKGYMGVLEERFCPKATTPSQMEDKLAAITIYGNERRKGLKTNVKNQQVIW